MIAPVMPCTLPPPPPHLQASMISPITSTQITYPVTLEFLTAREQLVLLALSCKVLETRLLQRLRFKYGEIYTVTVRGGIGVAGRWQGGGRVGGQRPVVLVEPCCFFTPFSLPGAGEPESASLPCNPSHAVPMLTPTCCWLSQVSYFFGCVAPSNSGR